MIRPTTLILMLTAASALLATEPFIPPVPDKQPEPPFPVTPPGAGISMLVPGFTVRELPVGLTNLNNVEMWPTTMNSSLHMVEGIILKLSLMSMSTDKQTIQYGADFLSHRNVQSVHFEKEIRGSEQTQPCDSTCTSLI